MEQDFAVTVARAESGWQVRSFKDDFSTIDTAVTAVRALRSETAAFAFLCVEDEYFMIVRPTPQGVRLFISDATQACLDEYAARVLGEMGVEAPCLSEEEFEDSDSWPEGDFDILADVGINEQILSIVCDEQEWWASEQIQRLCEELGCEEELARAVKLT